MTHHTSSANTTDLPTGYRMTELGPLPEEWRVVRLGDVYEIQQGKALSRKKDKGIRPRPFLRTANVLWGKVDLSTLDRMDFTVEEERKYALQSGDLLICEGGEIGRTAIWEGQMQGIFYQNHIFRVRAATQETEPRFHMYWMQAAITLLGLYRGRGNKTTIPNLSKRRLAEFPIPLPPLPEQRAIAHVLRTVQDAREATARVIAALRDLKRSLMRHLFTYGPVPVDAAEQVALQDTPIGPIPAHWRVVRLGEVAHKPQYGYTASASQEPVGPKFLRITDIQNDRVHWASVPFCVIEDDLLNKYRLREGDILFARIGATTGKTYLVREAPRAVFASYLIRVRAHSNQLVPEYLYFFTHTFQYWQQINAAKGGRLKQGINIPILTSLRIPLPPLPEQRQIARILQTVDRKIEAEEAREEALDALFRSLLHHLMTAKIRLPADFIARFANGNTT